MCNHFKPQVVAFYCLLGIANFSAYSSSAQKFDARILQFKPGVQIYATGLSLRELNKQFEIEGLQPVEDVISSFSFSTELIYTPLQTGFGISYGGGGFGSNTGVNYSGLRLSSFSFGLIHYFEITKSISVKSGVQYASFSTHIDQFYDLGIPGNHRFQGASFVNDAKAIEPVIELLHRPGKTRRFSYGLFATYYFVVSQSGWYFEQNNMKSSLPDLGNENNLKLGILCSYSFP